MCALIAMCCFDTIENQRTELTEKTLLSLYETVDWRKHRLIIIDNNSCAKTKILLAEKAGLWFEERDIEWTVITLPENIGTARAINLAIRERKPNEHVIKIDNDVIIHQSGWADQLEEAIETDPLIGIIGLKRKDCIQNPNHPDPNFKSELMLLQGKYLRWQVIEKTADVMGTCTMFNSALLDKIGYSYQADFIYGYEDVLFCHRAHLAGFYNCFLPHIEIDHIDPGDTDYQKWKEKQAGLNTQKMIDIFKQYVNGERSIYEEFN